MGRDGTFTTWIIATALAAISLLITTAQVAHAQCLAESRSDACSQTLGLSGFVSAVAGNSADADFPLVEQPLLPPAGRLIHADHAVLEAEARDLLLTSKEFRRTITPHTEKPDFDTLVAKFDYESGFNREIPGEGKTILKRINEADQDLRRARTIYGFLAVYASEARFRSGESTSVPCSPEPVLDDPIADPPVVDLCNFGARMREAVREAAYLRMIFGQQFTADALGLHFSGTEIVGGEAFVIKEVRQLQMAEEQYNQALDIVKEGLTIALGSGCYVADFYTQSEWSLLTRAVGGKERAQHHIAIRKSYLDVPSLGTGPEAAEDEFHRATAAQYVNMVGTAGQTSRRSFQHCARGTNPEGNLIAEMALNMLETREAARHLAEGRNVFGFDERFTPARPFRTSNIQGSIDVGILDEARRAAEYAKELQRDEEAATRIFDQKKTELTQAIQAVKNGRDEKIQAAAGCDRADPSLSNDAAYFACVKRVLSDLDVCVASQIKEARFNDCALNAAPVSDVRQSAQELRAVYIQIERLQREIVNIDIRIDSNVLRNTQVKSRLFTNAQEQSGFAVAEEIANCCTIDVGTGFGGGSINPGSPVAGAMRAGSIMRQAADMEILDAENKDVVRNFFLDEAELRIDLEVALQEYNAKLTEYEGIRDQTRHDVIEAQRERAYLQNSPANDPSFRLVRDSKRLTLASQLAYASEVSYLAARRAEYEFAARLAANNISLGEIYRARTADDILRFLDKLEATANNLIVSDAEINQEDFTLSVAIHVLGLTDEFLGLTGIEAEAERTRRFRAWVARNTKPGPDGKPVLDFDFTTSLADNGIFSNVIQQGFNRNWLFKISGVGQPKLGNTGFSVNLVSDQASLGYRRIAVSQSGVTHLRTRAGCIFDYRLLHPAVLVGQEWPREQPAESALSDFKAAVNGTGGEPTSAFLNRPVSASNWQVTLFAGAPESRLPEMNLLELTDVELQFSTTRSSRAPGTKSPTDPACVRVDF